MQGKILITLSKFGLLWEIFSLVVFLKIAFDGFRGIKMCLANWLI